MEELRKTLDQIRSRIEAAKKPGGPRMTEEDTKAKLINPVLRALGWDVEEWEQVRFEFKVKRMDRPVDYALLLRSTPRLLIEAKAIGEDIEDDKWAGQIMSYAGVVGAPWIALTNGDRWKVYRAGVDLPLDEKLFRSFGISDSDAGQPLALLARGSLQGSLIDEMWEEERVDRQVEKAVKDLFDTGGDLPVASQIRKRAEGLTVGQIRASLSRARVSIQFPKVPPPQPPPPVDPPPPAPDVTLASLIREGRLKPPVDLVRTYKGREVRARIEPDARIRVCDQLVDSPSATGGIAMAKASGKPTGGKMPACAGWTFWKIKGADGKLRPLDDMRRAAPAPPR